MAGIAIAPALCMALFSAGCGYMGEPLPPAMKRPVRVTDLAAVERGSNIVIHFTIPRLTTEGLPVKREDIELRVGPSEFPFQPALWDKTAEHIKVPINDMPVAVVTVPASRWYGKTVVVAVDVYGPHHRTAGPSNFKVLTIVPALPAPEAIEARDAPDAVQLTWHAAAPEFRIFRKLAGAPDLAQIGTSTKPSFLDSTIEYGKTYLYSVQSIEKTGDTADETYAESEISDVNAFRPKDTFAPAIPSNVLAVPGTRSIELVWDRNTEKDFAGYRVYRNGKKLAEGLTGPTYSDRDVAPGVKYQYQTTAVDTSGNESARSQSVESSCPEPGLY
ncbi:MAG: hypothetical protein M3N93_06590 [Acidobacteriota bacterium]|nr:hypothetical protein [Acidobacteriota bacterium]